MFHTLNIVWIIYTRIYIIHIIITIVLIIIAFASVIAFAFTTASASASDNSNGDGNGDGDGNYIIDNHKSNKKNVTSTKAKDKAKANCESRMYDHKASLMENNIDCDEHTDGEKEEDNSISVEVPIDDDPQKKSKRGRKTKLPFDPRQYDNEYITLWEDILEGEKVLVDNANNVYTFDLEHPVFIGKKDVTVKLDVKKVIDTIAKQST